MPRTLEDRHRFLKPVNLTPPERCERNQLVHRLNAVPPADQRRGVASRYRLSEGTRFPPRISRDLRGSRRARRAGPRRARRRWRSSRARPGSRRARCTECARSMAERGWVARESANGHIELGPRVAWLVRVHAGLGLDRRLPRGRRPAGGAPQRDHLPDGARRPRQRVHRQGGDHSSGPPGDRRGQPAAGVRGGVGPRDARGPSRGGGRCACTPDASSRLRPAGGSRGSTSCSAILREARRRGYAENIDETALGLHCLAAPVGRPGASRPRSRCACRPGG